MLTPQEILDSLKLRRAVQDAQARDTAKLSETDPANQWNNYTINGAEIKPSNAFTFYHNNGALITIATDGTVTLGEGITTLDEASNVFWKQVEAMGAGQQKELATLRAEVSKLEASIDVTRNVLSAVREILEVEEGASIIWAAECRMAELRGTDNYEEPCTHTIDMFESHPITANELLAASKPSVITAYNKVKLSDGYGTISTVSVGDVCGNQITTWFVGDSESHWSDNSGHAFDRAMKGI